MSIQQQVSRAIRILRGNRDVSARASHLVVQQDQLMTYESVLVGQAEMEKFSKSTFSERKIMSTKTSIKRIAAVAAVALTLGGFSAVSAHATWTGQGDSLTLNTAASTTTVGVKVSTSFTVGFLPTAASDTYTVTASVTTLPSGATSLPVLDSGTVTGYTDTNVNTPEVTASRTKTITGSAGLIATTGPKTVAGGYVKATYTASLTPDVAGTYVIKLTPSTGDTANPANATAVTWTVTVGAAVVGKSTAYISVGTASPSSDTEAAAVTTPITSVYSATAAVANIQVKQYADTAGTTALGSSLTQSVVATLTGSGILGTSSTVATGRSLAVAAGTSTANVAYDAGRFYIFADGTAGVGTVTISVGGVVVATKTVTFYGKAAKAVSSLTYAGVLSTGGATKVGAATVVVTDAAGNPVSGLTGANFTVTSSDTTVLASTTTTTVAADDGTGTGTYNVDITSVANTSGKSATATISVVSGTTVLATAAPLTFTLGGTTVYSMSLAFDAASYAAGDKATLTLTAKDSLGNAVADGTYAVFASTLTAFGGLASSAAVTTTPFSLLSTAAGTTFKNGAATATVYAPSVAGNWTVSATTVYAAPMSAAIIASGAGVALKATAAITSAAADAAQAAVDAANEATDAANAATDAANNAMDSADAAQQAALDAGDKADAALAAVTDLASKVADIATQISALSSLVSKIAASVAKISAKVKA